MYQGQIAEYDAAEIGSYVHWFGGWNSYAGTVQWANEWAPTEYGRLNERERLIVVAVPEQVNERGIDSRGGLFLLSVHRWTATEGQMIGEHYSVSHVASTGIRYRRPVDEFIAGVIERHEAERALDRAIAEQSSEEMDR
jgi:hypothetical protein